MLQRLAVAAALAALLPAGSSVLTVHVVPHTHDDVGWLKTVDQYYAGVNPQGQSISGYVKMILDTVIRSLQENPERKFTYVEQAFFQRWWREQTPAVQNLTRDLVKAGRLEFTNGGWCMHDEAAAYYLDMIDQTTVGHRFLIPGFGVSPSTGWQLDPFGHSATQAALLSAEVGFNGLFFGRIDYQDLANRINKSEAEFVWRASPSLGRDVQVFSGLTGEYGGNYGPPNGLDFENGDAVQDDTTLEDNNVKRRVQRFVGAALWQASHTRGSNIMFTMGSDFQYENAFKWFESLDKIIKYVNLDGRVHARYSTPAEYVRAKTQEVNVSWPLKTDDFFPYADTAHQFWTGYFTSRPALKRYIRETSAVLQVVRQVAAAHHMAAQGGGPPSGQLSGVAQLEQAMGVAQHHDAVSGTAKQHVTFDYARRLAAGRAAALSAVAGALGNLTGVAQEGAGFTMCDLRNVSVCAPTQAVVAEGASGVDFVLWNGLSQARTELVELPVGSSNVSVTDGSGAALPVQLVASLPSVTNYAEAANGSSLTAVFAAELPPLGYRTFRLRTSSEAPPAPAPEAAVRGEPVVLENEYLRLEFVAGTLSTVLDKSRNLSAQVRQSWLWYNGSAGNSESTQTSGAYIFRPNRSEASPVFNGTPTLRLSRGPLAEEVHQEFGPWVSQRVRLAKAARHVEITYTVGPVPVQDQLGKEVITRFTTDIANAGECFTDSNGREMMARKRDYRATWNLSQTEPVAGNYYPVTASIFIRDARRQLTVLTDAAQAGSGCVTDGELELMVHRRLLHDDFKGVGEPLNESLPNGAGLVTRGRHLLVLSDPATAAATWRPLADAVYMPPLPFFAPGYRLPGAQASYIYSILTEQLPPNVQVATLSRWDDAWVLLRLAHQFGVGEDAVLSQPAEVDLGKLFAGMAVAAVEERGLAASISRAEVLRRRVPWPVEGEPAVRARPAAAGPAAPGGELVYELGPLQIRTFLVRLEQVGPQRGAGSAVLV
ncbi:unnamed protein product [Prorocentrum cordatum]|uniref:Alpha-mannosidase n=1 Tax=Prorocentrum cordatum TaxID=2364126 RepID=A0ABN9QCJ0_9DINO|nr:unnamed protein product [Polarella glacialis]